MKVKYPIIKPYLPPNAFVNVKKVLDSGWLTQGKYVSLLEEKIRSYLKVRYAFLLNSATSGLIVAAKSLNLKDKDEVIVPSFTFPATANSVILGGAKPVFCDVSLKTFNILPDKIEAIINKRTKAIIPVHEFGLSADMDEIKKIARKYNLYVIEDAACALGTEYKSIKAGTLGYIGIFSFHPRKIITCGEGGCVVTNSQKVYQQICYLRNHGEFINKFINSGYNFRLTDIQSAILLSQFDYLEEIIDKRIKSAMNYNYLLKSLEDKELLRTPVCPSGYRHTYQSYVVLLAKQINRDKLKSILKQKGIETQFGTYCLPLLDFYKNNFNISKYCYKNAEYAYRHTLTLPLYYGLKINQQEFITNQLHSLIKKCVQ